MEDRVGSSASADEGLKPLFNQCVHHPEKRDQVRFSRSVRSYENVDTSQFKRWIDLSNRLPARDLNAAKPGHDSPQSVSPRSLSLLRKLSLDCRQNPSEVKSTSER